MSLMYLEIRAHPNGRSLWKSRAAIRPPCTGTKPAPRSHRPTPPPHRRPRCHGTFCRAAVKVRRGADVASRWPRGTVAEAARQRCGSGTVPACFRWTIGALFGRSKREKPGGFCRVFGPWTAGAEAHLFWRGQHAGAAPALDQHQLQSTSHGLMGPLRKEKVKKRGDASCTS